MNRRSNLSPEMEYRLLHLLNENPEANQRELAAALGISVGKVNYCLRALVAKGLVKIRSFTNHRNKAAYLYLLTRRGLREKARVTVRFLRQKLAEYDALEKEIETIREQVRRQGRGERK